jgi:hypothetical protein
MVFVVVPTPKAAAPSRKVTRNSMGAPHRGLKNQGKKKKNNM